MVETPKVLLKHVKLDPCPYSRKRIKHEPVELPIHLRDEIEDLKRFWTTGGEREWDELKRRRREANGSEGVRPRVDIKGTALFDKGMRYLITHFFRLQMMKGVDPQTWHLIMLTEVEYLREFNAWMLEIGNSHANALHLVDAGLAVAKKTHFTEVRRSDWTNVDAVMDIRELRRTFDKANRRERKLSKKRKLPYRKLSHKQLQQVCQVIYTDCIAQVTEAKNKHTVVWAWQAFVIVVILTYVAVRQQEPRQYREGDTLFREVIGGKEIYVVRNIHHKLEHLSGETREYCLPSILTPYLDNWLNVYRPIAQRAVQNLSSWLEFWGHKPDELERLEQRLNLAQQGQPARSVKDIEKYCENLSKEIRAIKNKINAWKIARENLEKYDTLFFSFGISHPNSFGKPLSSESLCNMVVLVVGKATKLLFGKTFFISPHIFRNIAAWHVFNIKGDIEGTADQRGHSTEMAKEYADSFTDGVDRTQGLDNWWEP